MIMNKYLDSYFVGMINLFGKFCVVVVILMVFDVMFISVWVMIVDDVVKLLRVCEVVFWVNVVVKLVWKVVIVVVMGLYVLLVEFLKINGIVFKLNRVFF